MKLEWRRWPPGASGSGQRELVGFRDKVSEVVQTQSRDVRGYRLRSSNQGGVDDGFVLGRRFKAIDSAIEDISEQLAVLEIPAEEAPADAIPESIGDLERFARDPDKEIWRSDLVRQPLEGDVFVDV
jgi:hypothetical protein